MGVDHPKSYLVVLEHLGTRGVKCIGASAWISCCSGFGNLTASYDYQDSGLSVATFFC